jgi:hypothetical protein
MVVGVTDDLVHRFCADLWNRWDDAVVDLVLSPTFAFRGSLGTSTAGRSGYLLASAWVLGDLSALREQLGS